MTYQFEEESLEDRGIHPIWRGIGCLMFILIPILGWGISNWFIGANLRNGWVPLPSTIYQAVVIEQINYVVPQYFVAKVVFTAFFVAVMYAGLMMIYALLYRIIIPSQRSPYDVPALKPRKKPKRSR